MTNMRLLAICLFTISLPASAKTFIDNGEECVFDFFKCENATYIIRYHYRFSDTLFIPKGCKLLFEGGGLTGPIVFKDTKLSGLVNLKGSSISGTIRNKKFDASWLCTMDGLCDDAQHINEIIEVCNNIFFPKGTYRLISEFNPKGDLADDFSEKTKAHIGINKKGVVLKGEDGAVFLSNKPIVTICIFSLPFQIDNCIGNIRVDNLEFVIENDGSEFHQFMHTIKVIGVDGLLIENCRFSDFWGDAICLSHYGDTPQTGERTRNQHIKILNNNIVGGVHHNNRNGISIINGKDVLIKGNIIKNTSRYDMPGGIDVEPNNSAYTIDNIRIENNTLEGIRGGGGAICLVAINKGSAHHVLIKDNKIYDSNNGISLYIDTEGTTDSIFIIGNYIDDKTNPYRFFGKGISKNWMIRKNTFDHPCKQIIPGEIKVDGLIVNRNKKKE